VKDGDPIGIDIEGRHGSLGRCDDRDTSGTLSVLAVPVDGLVFDQEVTVRDRCLTMRADAKRGGRIHWDSPLRGKERVEGVTPSTPIKNDDQ